MKVYFSVVDKKGDAIATLTESDIRVLDDGKPQTIASFERVNGQPFAVAVLFDTSLSETRLADTAKLTARTVSLLNSARN